ncbi:MAG: hypothetical protein HZA31_01605 [Opitutae bacterium]|nr:hypothetical protein [Opitutae bacterium]
MHRILLLFFLAVFAATGRTESDLAQVHAARELLGPDIWAQAIRVENTGRHHRYPAQTYALVFEFEGILWLYTPYDGTQSFSIYRGRLAQDRQDFGPLLREIEPGFERHEVLPEEPAATATAPRSKPANACFIASLAALRAKVASGEVTRAALLSYYYDAGGRYGHTVLTYETRAGHFVLDPARSDQPEAVSAGMVRDAVRLASAIQREHRIAQARLLPVDLAKLTTTTIDTAEPLYSDSGLGFAPVGQEFCAPP